VVGWVKCLLFGSSKPFLVWVWKISPKNPKFCNFFPSGQKKISSGRSKKYPDQSRVGFLFTAGQKYAWVGSGPISRTLSSLFTK